MEKSLLYQGLSFLHQNGFPIISILDTQTIPNELMAGIREENIAVDKFPRLMLVAHGGTRFWESFSEGREEVDHPVDHFSIAVTDRFFETYLPEVSTIRLFPQAYQLPIQQLSRHAGWSFPSPLGMDIHPIFGLWYAYRSIYLVKAELLLKHESYRRSPCDNCGRKPCFEACPSGAVGGIDKFDTNACITYRMSENSSCTDTCLARVACPAGAQHRYPAEQMSYHYLYSLHAYQRYYENRLANR